MINNFSNINWLFILFPFKINRYLRRNTLCFQKKSVSAYFIYYKTESSFKWEVIYEKKYIFVIVIYKENFRRYGLPHRLKTILAATQNENRARGILDLLAQWKR